jgi:hypothetical protein
MTFKKHHFELVAIDKSLPGTKLVVLGDENEQYTKQPLLWAAVRSK